MPVSSIRNFIASLSRPGKPADLDRRIRELESSGELGPFFRHVQQAKQIEPSPGFLPRLMDALPDQQSSGWQSGWRQDWPAVFRLRLSKLYLAVFRPKAAHAGRITREDCAFYLFLAAFVHLPVAMILAIGVRKLNPLAPEWGWVLHQPLVLTALAVWLFLMGVYAWRGGYWGIRAALAGVLLYLGFFTFNSVLPFLIGGLHPYLWPFAGQAVSGVLIGSLLAAAIRISIRRNHQNGESHA